jgi:hypothetical protein
VLTTTAVRGALFFVLVLVLLVGFTQWPVAEAWPLAAKVGIGGVLGVIAWFSGGWLTSKLWPKSAADSGRRA